MAAWKLTLPELPRPISLVASDGVRGSILPWKAPSSTVRDTFIWSIHWLINLCDDFVFVWSTVIHIIKAAKCLDEMESSIMGWARMMDRQSLPIWLIAILHIYRLTKLTCVLRTCDPNPERQDAMWNPPMRWLWSSRWSETMRNGPISLVNSFFTIADRPILNQSGIRNVPSRISTELFILEPGRKVLGDPALKPAQDRVPFHDRSCRSGIRHPSPMS